MLFSQALHAYKILCNRWVPWGFRQNLNTPVMQRNAASYNPFDNFIRTFSSVVWVITHWTKASWTEHLFNIIYCDMSEWLLKCLLYISLLYTFIPSSAYSVSRIPPTVAYTYQPWKTNSNPTVQLTEQQGNTLLLGPCVFIPVLR